MIAAKPNRDSMHTGSLGCLRSACRLVVVLWQYKKGSFATYKKTGRFRGGLPQPDHTKLTPRFYRGHWWANTARFYWNQHTTKLSYISRPCGIRFRWITCPKTSGLVHLFWTCPIVGVCTFVRPKWSVHGLRTGWPCAASFRPPYARIAPKLRSHRVGLGLYWLALCYRG